MYRVSALCLIISICACISGCRSTWPHAERVDTLEAYLACLEQDPVRAGALDGIKITPIGTLITHKLLTTNVVFGAGYDLSAGDAPGHVVVRLGAEATFSPPADHVFLLVNLRLQNLPLRQVDLPAKLLYLSDDNDNLWWGRFWVPIEGRLREQARIMHDDRPLSPGDYIRSAPVIRWWRLKEVPGAWVGTKLELGAGGIRAVARFNKILSIPTLNAPAVTGIDPPEYVADYVRANRSAPHVVSMLFTIPADQVGKVHLNYIGHPMALTPPQSSPIP